VEAGVDEVRGYDVGGDEAGQLVEAEGGAVLRQEGVRRVVEPARLAKREDVPVACRQGLQESRQAAGIEPPPEWELVEDGAKRVPQGGEAPVLVRQRLRRVLQLLQVGDEAVGLDGEVNPGGTVRRQASNVSRVGSR
jgi:hypothetical protein